MQRTRVLYIGPPLEPAGATMVMRDFLNGVDRGVFQPAVIVHGGRGLRVEEFLRQDVEVFDFRPQLKWYSRGVVRRLQMLCFFCGTIRDYRPDCLLVDMRRAIFMSIVARALLRSATPIVSRWGTVMSPRLRWYDWFERTKIRFFLPKVQRIVVPSQMSGTDLVQNFGISADLIDLVPNAIDTARIDESQRHATVPVRGATIVLVVGSLSPLKDPVTVLRAFVELRRDHDAELWFVGDGVLRSDLERMAKTLQVSDVVKFWGHQTNPYGFMKVADLFVHASHADGFGMAMLEALYFRLPVVFADSPIGLTEAMKKVAIGRGFKPGDADDLAAAIRDMLGRDREAITKPYDAFLRDYDLERFVRAYEAAIQKAVEASDSA